MSTLSARLKKLEQRVFLPTAANISVLFKPGKDASPKEWEAFRKNSAEVEGQSIIVSFVSCPS